MDIALAAFAALRDGLALAGHYHIGEDLAAFIIYSDGAGRDAHDEVIGGLAVLLLAAAAFAVACDQSRLIFEIEERRHSLVDFEDDAAATAAIAAGRPAHRAIFFAQECDGAITALARVHEDTCLIDKPHFRGDAILRDSGVGSNTSSTPPRSVLSVLTKDLGRHDAADENRKNKPTWRRHS